MKLVTNEPGKFSKKPEDRLVDYFDVEAIHLLQKSELVRRLKRKHLLRWFSVH